MRLSGRTFLVTGAAGGIGRALIDALLAHSPRKIYAADVADGPTHAAPQVERVRIDITDHAAVDRMARQCADVEVLVNNAGINLRGAFIAPDSLDAARREMEVNYFGTAAMCRSFAPVLAANGGGAIVNVLSILAKVTNPPLGSYCASKAALLRLTECIRAELASQKTFVMAAMPWAVDTPMSGPFPGSKSAPAEVAAGIVEALVADMEDVVFHEKSLEIERRLREDPKGLEREFAMTLKR
jgi:NAD(P)-dependent dehydrogenase (short-subunit alcohol dehydrogenase family)